MNVLELRGVSKGFGRGSHRQEVLKNVDLTVAEGEFVAILGFSGAGKSTLVSLLAGLTRPDAGEVRFRGELVTGPSRERGVVFQNYSLMPWMTVSENVGLAVDSVFSDKTGAERREMTRSAIEMVGLGHAADRRPAALSGGMRQRTSVARALAVSPDVLLLDEPLSALDALTRAKLQDELESIRASSNRSFVLVTNDVDEALLLADRVIPLTRGPGATLDKAFEINLPRPRDRAELNHHAGFKRLRAQITTRMMEIGAVGAMTAAGTVRDLAPHEPIRLDEMRVPKAVVESAEARSGREDRFLQFSQVTKVYPTPKGDLTVVKDIDLSVRKGEFISLIGHSGCGKSTLLTMCAGLTEVTRGGVILDGREVDEAGPDRAVVFQSPSLMPWLTARQNVSLGVDKVYPHLKRAERRDIVDYYLGRVGLADAAERKASDLSNGMKQRVGLARAFALSPKLLLLDEPFGMLDSLTRWDLQEVLMDVWSRSEVTAVCVTHDVDEAILLADRVVMMTNGPEARIGKIMPVDLPRPRTRKALLDHPRYYEYREQVLAFLEEYEHGSGAAKAAA